MTLPATLFHPSQGRLQSYMLWVTIFALLISIATHALTVYAIGLQLRPAKASPIVRARKVEPPRDTLQFVALDDRPDEASRPEQAQARGKHSRRARDVRSRLELPKGAPFVHKGSPVTPIKSGPTSPRQIRRIPTPVPPPKPQKRPVPQAERPEQPRPPLGEMPAEPTRPVKRVAPDKKEPKPIAKTPDQPRRRPRVIDMRNTPPSTGSGPRQNRKTTAELAGTRSMEILKARWGQYMEQVALQIHRAVLAEQTAARRSFHAGRITLHFGIQPDGSITKPRLLVAPQEMLSERGLAVRALLNAAPFPKLTEEMTKDPNFGRITVNFIFQ